MIDAYTRKIIKKIKTCTNDEEVEFIINNVYEDGFNDGVNSSEE